LTYSDSILEEALRNRYVLERELGRGGMATVYLARDVKHDRLVALKVLHPELAAMLGPDRFLREIKFAAGLQHPHILSVHDSGESAGRLWFTMPYVEGESLRDRLRREGQLPVDDAVQITREAAQALDYAHQHGVIHRDIKPENILLTKDGNALVADFGIARALAGGEEERLTETGLNLGTPAYMSPEQATAGSVDARSDIYSLGCVTYEMLAGQLPFTAASAQGVLARHLADPVPRLRTVRPSVLPAIEEAIAKALAKVPADRFATATQFAEALGTTHPETAPTPYRTLGSPLRIPFRLIPLLVLAVIAIGAGTLWLRESRGPRLMPRRIVVSPFQNQAPGSSLAPLGDMTMDRLADGIQHIEGLEVVPSRFTFLLSLNQPPNADHTQQGTLRRLAAETGASTVVSGSYYLAGDSLIIQPQIVDAASGKLLRPMNAEGGSMRRPMEVIERVRERVMGALASQFHTEAPAVEGTGSPPTFSAYQSYLAGLNMALAFKYPEALSLLDSAVKLDPDFLGAWFTKADVHYNLAGLLAATRGIGDSSVAFEFSRGDSAQGVLRRLRGRMSSAQGYYLDWMEAGRRGDLTGSLRALKRTVAVAPDPVSSWMAALFALRVNRPQEAIDIWVDLDPRSSVWTPVTWQVPTEAYHMLGKHSQELKEASHVREEHPDLLISLSLELTALAALDRVDLIEQELDQGIRLAPQPGWWTFGSLSANTALELRAHGDSSNAARVMQRAVDWYREKATTPGATRLDRYGLARTLYWARRWPEADQWFTRLLTEAPGDPDYLGYSGVTAAREGDRQKAKRVSERLAAKVRPYPLFGHPTLWRARIAALTGEPDSAVSLLRKAISEGLSPLDVTQGFGYAMWLHRDIDFEGLRDYRPFTDMLASSQ
jgi:serine/threonine protein kinase/tetratricopeptide (TPR) repeat protein